MKLISKIVLITILFFSWNFNSIDLNFKTEIQAETLSDWYNADWNYRKPINISGSPSVLADFQVLITIDTAVLMSDGKMRLDCGDFRFTDSDGKTELDYWIESGCNSPDTKVWVKVPFIPISGTTIYMYYGNPLVQSVSNGEKTFEFFDDFKDGSDKWIGSGQEYSTSNTGYIHVSQTGIGEVFSSLVSNVIGSGDFKVNLKLKNESSKKYKDCDYKYELKLINDEEETILDSSSYQEFTDKKYRISGNDLKLKLYGYAKGCEDTIIKSSQASYNGCEGCTCKGNQCPCLNKYVPNDDAPLCPEGYKEIKYYCENEDFYDNYLKCHGTDCREYRECKNTNLLTYVKLWIDDIYIYKYALSEPVAIIGTEEKNDESFSSADLNCDRSVNAGDMAILLNWWDKSSSGFTCCQNPDLNSDGIINAADFAIMMSQWTTF